MPEQPPLGVEPRWAAAERRRDAVAAAIDRYEAAGQVVPELWRVEVEELDAAIPVWLAEWKQDATKLCEYTEQEANNDI